MYQYLNPDNLYEQYESAKDATELLTDPFPEFERIARNKPSANIEKGNPNVTDGTTASIIRKTPKRVVQQLPTGVVESEDDDAWLPVVAGFIYLTKILPNANDEYDLIQKCWNVIERALTFGAVATYTPIINHDGELGPDLTVPYWGDVFIQKGKKSGYSANCVFIRSWWQKADLEALIDAEQKRAKEAKKKDYEYEPTWDVKALRSILDTSTTKDDKAKTPSEEEHDNSVSAIELITAFQKGLGAKFYTFHAGEEIIVRTQVNKDPRGKIPIDWMYGDIDGSNPYGRGLVELIGSLQNLIDSDMQMYQFNRALMLAPPVIKKGQFSKKKIIYKPNAVIDLGADPNASIETLGIDTTAIQNYPNIYGLQKSQLLNLTSSPDTSISAEVGNPGFGRTPTAINTQQATISIDDNYVRKMFEAWFQNWSETAINRWFAERQGTQALKIDNDTKQQLQALADEGKFDMTLINEKDELLINYDEATPALKFRVDASTSKMKDDKAQLDGLGYIWEMLKNNPEMAQFVPAEKKAAAWNAIVNAAGIEDPENLTIDIEELKQKQEQLMQAQDAQTQAQATAQPQKMAVNYKDAPEDIKRQMEEADGFIPSNESSPIQQANELKSADLQLKTHQAFMPQQGQIQANPELDDQIAEHLKSLGFNDQVISHAIAQIDNGAPADHVLAQLGVQ